MADAPKITPITIKPIAIKPMAPKPAAPAAAAAPAPAPAAPAASGPAIKPIVIAPGGAAGKPLSADGNTATIRLSPSPKPAAPAPAPAPAAPAAPKPIAIKPSVAPAAPAPAPAPAAAPAVDESAPTVVIKPIAIKPKVVAPASTAEAKPVAPNPQAMKSTTSRISLDSALAQPPTQAAPAAMGKITSNLTQAGIDAAKGRTAKVSLTIQDQDSVTRHQTIRVKAPTPGAAPASEAPAPEAPIVAPAAADAAKPAMPADASEAPTVRKKSLVLKKPGGAGAPSGATTKPTLKLKADPGAPKPAADGAAPAAEGGKDVGLDGIETPPAAMSQGGALQANAAPKKKTHWIFPLVAFLDIAALIAVIVIFMAETCGPDRCLTDYTTFKGMFDSPLALSGSVLVN